MAKKKAASRTKRSAASAARSKASKTTAPTSRGRGRTAASRTAAGGDENIVQAGSVRIRMYNVGFGDCFLLWFPGPERVRKVLIDCGKHTHSKCGPSLERIVKQVQADLRESDGTARVDLLVVTHRHQDHVSGSRLDGWDEVEVGEVWMPWVEDPYDPVARRICERQSMRALQLQEFIPLLNLDANQKQYLLGYAGNNLTNAPAMRVLHEGFRGQPKRQFLPAENAAASVLQCERLPNVEVHVLGPSRSEQVIRDMDPPPGESFLAATAAAIQGQVKPESPFSQRWKMDRKAFSQWFTSRNLNDPLADFSARPPSIFGGSWRARKWSSPRRSRNR